MRHDDVNKLFLPEVEEITGYKKNLIYSLMADDKFPDNEPHKFVPSSKVWNRDEVVAWANGTWQPSVTDN